MEVEFRVKKIVNGLPHLGEVKLKLDFTEINKLEIIESYKGEGWITQGSLVSIPEEGFGSWKSAIIRGISYAYSKLTLVDGLKVEVVTAIGIPATDTNATIIGYAASRAILENLENSETEVDFKLIEDLMYSSWNYEYDALPDFNKKIIEGKTINRKMYNERKAKVWSIKILWNYLREWIN